MVPHLKGVPNIVQDPLLKEYLKSVPPKIEIPLSSFNWWLFMKDVKNLTKNNFYPFLMLLSGAVSAFHNETVLSIIGKLIKSLEILSQYFQRLLEIARRKNSLSSNFIDKIYN